MAADLLLKSVREAVEEAMLIASFDLFRKDADGNAVWLDCKPDLVTARDRLTQLAIGLPASTSSSTNPSNESWRESFAWVLISSNRLPSFLDHFAWVFIVP
jgi:hypothetical protein